MRRWGQYATYTGQTPDELREKFSQTYFREDGAVAWKSNGRVPFEDMLTDWQELGLIEGNGFVSFCLMKKSFDDKRAIQEYKEAMANRTPEQIAEERAMARAAFGEGVEITNIFTGETY